MGALRIKLFCPLCLLLLLCESPPQVIKMFTGPHISVYCYLINLAWSHNIQIVCTVCSPGTICLIDCDIKFEWTSNFLLEAIIKSVQNIKEQNNYKLEIFKIALYDLYCGLRGLLCQVSNVWRAAHYIAVVTAPCFLSEHKTHLSIITSQSPITSLLHNILLTLLCCKIPHGGDDGLCWN